MGKKFGVVNLIDYCRRDEKGKYTHAGRGKSTIGSGIVNIDAWSE